MAGRKRKRSTRTSQLGESSSSAPRTKKRRTTNQKIAINNDPKDLNGTQSMAEPIGLFKLALETRQRIYGYVFEGSKLYLKRRCISLRKTPPSTLLPPLFQVSKQISHEALTPYFEASQISVPGAPQATYLSKWLHAADQCKSVRSVYFPTISIWDWHLVTQERKVGDESFLKLLELCPGLRTVTVNLHDWWIWLWMSARSPSMYKEMGHGWIEWLVELGSRCKTRQLKILCIEYGDKAVSDEIRRKMEDSLKTDLEERGCNLDIQICT